MSPEQDEVLKSCIQGFKALKTVILAMDNDQGGERLIQKIKNILENSGFSGEIVCHSPETQGQDWNNVLKDRG
ncbi:MAG: toprim domain-containing protein [Alphaproteobacteria bacterium]